MPMFLKPFRVKSNTQMKGSDKKKLKATLKKHFPNLSDDDLNILLPTKDEIVVSKIYTFAEESVLLYIHGKNTVFFELEKEKIFYPSVYTLWKNPDLLPCFTTWTPVMARIANGADLLLPGVIIDEEKGMKAYGEGTLEKGDTVTVNLQSNRAPVAVGTAWLSSEDMYMAGRRGKCAGILHFYGDQLWAAGTRDNIPNLEPPSLPFLEKQGIGEQEDLEEEDGGDNGEVVCEGVENLKVCDTAEEPAEEPNEKSAAAVEEGQETRSPAEVMDGLLKAALLQSLRTTASEKKAELPMLSSNFYRLHMVPNSPHPLDVKKSSHKKLGKFLASMERLGVLKVSELSKGVESVVWVDWQHELVATHRVFKLDKPEPEPEPEVSVCDRKYEPPTIVELFMVTANVVKLFKTANISKGSALTAQEVRQVIVDYVKEKDLQSEQQKGKVQLDELLAEVVLAKGDNGSACMKWEELIKFVIGKMSPGYSLQFEDQPALEFKGRLEPVELTTATRSGNKKVTLVNNLETYHIDPVQFAHKCQVGLSVGTSQHPAPHRKSGTEVVIQGNHVAFAVTLLLEEYQVPKKYIKGLENAVKPKKQK